MDYYKELGLNQSATKNEIKEAYRKLAVKYHPDKHTQSSKPIRDGATLRFRQISEAYEVLVDDRKRADYNLRCRSGGGAGASSSNSSSSGRGGGGGGGYSYNDEYGYDNNNKRPKYRSTTSSSGTRQGNKWGFIFEFITTRRLLLNLAFVSVVLGGSALIESSEEALWKKCNSGKTFEEAMESIEKTKRQKEKTKRQKEKM